MAHRFTFTIEVTLERESGKFASRDEMADALVDVLEQADPGTVDGIGSDGDSYYTVSDFTVEEVSK